MFLDLEALVREEGKKTLEEIPVVYLSLRRASSQTAQSEESLSPFLPSEPP